MNYTDEQMDEISSMSQSQKRAVLDLFDRFGDERYWVGRYTEGQERGDGAVLLSVMTTHQDAATLVREQVKSLLFPNGGV